MSIKSYIRRLQKEEKALWLTDTLRRGFMAYKNAKDYLNLRSNAFELTNPTPTVEERVSVAMDGLNGAIRPIQKREEILGLGNLVEELEPKYIIEIGTAKGGSLFVICRSAPDDATIISIDLPFGRNGGGYPKWKEKYYSKFAKPGQKLHLLRGNSQSEAAFEEVKRILNGNKVDFMFVDGDHSYNGVKADYLKYKELLSDKGAICFHDILENRFDPTIDVARFWNELEGEKSEIVEDYEQGNAGIGVIKMS